MRKTLYLSKKLVSPRLKLMLDQCPSAGPFANLTGMRKFYWGENALVVKVGVYIYHVNLALFIYCKMCKFVANFKP